MKKLIAVALMVLFVSSVLTSCRHHACVGVTTSVQKAKGSSSTL